jgi:phospholipid/cholesterol/gamma-HCH transport system permease protein
MKSAAEVLPAALLQVRTSTEGILTLAIAGRLESTTTGAVWRQVMQALEGEKVRRVILDASRLTYCDGAGVALLLQLRRHQLKTGGELEIYDLQEPFDQLLDLYSRTKPEISVPAPTESLSLVEQTGRASVQLWRDVRVLISFVGELSLGLRDAASHPRRVRWKDALLTAELAGVNALPIVALIGFLLGLIMAFQAAIPMRQFGADIFVANLIGLSMLRELGPLITAILLAGRSASAFAAELGTMKVREEIDALTTMGLDPLRFLAVPRVIAVVAMTPLLVVFANLFGLIGGAVVMLSLGFTLTTYVNQILASADAGDLFGGLFKSVAFGLVVAAIGCLRGLQTKTGASAVGISTTRAVVSGIVLIAIVDGIFAVVYYYLDI